MFLLDWILASISKISNRPLLFRTIIRPKKSIESLSKESSKSTLSRRSVCQMIAPGLPRQRLDGLEIIVQCECEDEEDEETTEDECPLVIASPTKSFVSKKTSMQLPSYCDSGCQTSFCDISSLPEVRSTSFSDLSTICPNQVAACSSPEERPAPLPNIDEAFAQAISQQAWLRYSQKAINFATADEQCAGLEAAEEMWKKMTALQKLPYYWNALEHDPICKKPFDNFSNFFKARRKTKSPRAHNKIEKAWKRMNFKQRLPFIVEGFIYKMINSERCFDEMCVKKYFDIHRRQARRAERRCQR